LVRAVRSFWFSLLPTLLRKKIKQTTRYTLRVNQKSPRG
jgi:hypothetical protein